MELSSVAQHVAQQRLIVLTGFFTHVPYSLLFRAVTFRAPEKSVIGTVRLSAIHGFAAASSSSHVQIGRAESECALCTMSIAISQTYVVTLKIHHN